MNIIGQSLRRVWYQLNRRRLEKDLQREMDIHRAMMADPKTFGNTLRLREQSLDEWGWAWLDHLCQDVRYALRGFLRAPAFSIAAIATIALGIGSTTAVFSVVDRILFRSLPYTAEDRLVSVGLVTPYDSNEFLEMQDYRKWRAGQIPFVSMTAFTPVTASEGGNCDLGDQNLVRLNCAFVDSTFLSTFGVHPFIGRDFTASDIDAQFPNVVLLSYSLWKSHFAGATDVAGKIIPLDGHPALVIGVLPPTFEMPTLAGADLLAPLTSKTSFVRAFARLKPGLNIFQVQQALQPQFEDALKSSLMGSMYGKDKIHLEIRSVRDRQVQDARAVSYVLAAAVFLVLIIACTNVANLMLARATARDREFAVRRAIGADRTRLARQTLTESLLLSVAGGVVGLGVAYAALRIFIALGPQGIPRLNQATLDARVLFFTIAASITAGILFGVAPSLHLTAAHMLRTRTVAISRTRFRQLLVVAQISLSVVLLSGAVLLVRTLWNLEKVPLGMNTENVTVVSIHLGQSRYSRQEQQFAFFEELEHRLQEFPSIGRYAITDATPPKTFGTMSFAAIRVEGTQVAATGVGDVVDFRHITPEYFSVLGVPLLRGRFFTESDRDPGPPAVILSDALAHRLFGAADPIGRHVRLVIDPMPKEWITVVGVVANVRNNPSLTGMDNPEWYFPKLHDQSRAGIFFAANFTTGTIFLRSLADLRSTADSIRKLVATVDPTLPITIETMPQRVAQLTDRPRFTAALLGAFAIIAVLLAAVGLSGVLSFFVIQRTQEIGVRMALGATTGSVVRLIVGYALQWTAFGIIVGVGLSLVAARALRSLLFQVPERDPWTLALTSIALLFVALLAAWIPSSRASRIDPMVALRHD